MTIGAVALAKPPHLVSAPWEIAVVEYQVQPPFRGRAAKLVLGCRPLRGPYVDGVPLWDSGGLPNSYLPTGNFDHPEGTVIPWYFNILHANPDGTVAQGYGSKLMNEYANVTNTLPSDPARIDPQAFLGRQLLVEISTVKRDDEGTERNALLYKSKVQRSVRSIG